ncbi:MAG: type II toxin-antitoxin system RelE/ParE family toxin [Paludibacteraceae bacterium]
MVVVFDKTYLQELYQSGKTNDKRHRFQPDIIKRYQRCIDLMIVVPNADGLKQYRGLRFEALKGDKAGLYSIRVNNQYRIEFQLSALSEQTVMTICNIVELSNHYE